ncbi:hypothetical protein H6P81_015120 [Aristolochia fimbriata]|uniref:Reverse transcriptase domain-containing protein n=1 Tax=Aristolochia fimbriata TaxID=158543 RepID=A0AAV7E4D4_ARIFI|nr:hypothetical protein H6P81_015120 [Aristolochia fimbriata]
MQGDNNNQRESTSELRKESTSELRKESTSELRRKPWEAGKGVAIPEELKAGFSLFDGARRWYIDVVSLKGELAVKIASKSSNQRSYVRIPLCEVESVRSNFLQLTKLGTPGKTKFSHNKRIEVGIFEEDGKPLWRFVEKRGTTTVGTVDIPKSAGAGKGWKWIDESLSKIHGRTSESDARAVPHQKIRPFSHTQTNMYTYWEALLTDRQRIATKEPPISVGLIQGRPTVTVRPKITHPWIEELSKCLIVRLTAKNFNGRELAKTMKGSWRLVEQPSLSFLNPNTWLVNLASKEEQRRILALQEQLADELIQEIIEWSPSFHAIDPSTWVSIKGIPLHLWREEIFRAIGNLAGDVKEIDIDAMQGVRLDCARVKIQAFPTFAGRMSVTLKVGEFQYMALLEDEHKQRKDPRVEGKKKGRSRVKEKKRTRRKISRIWRKKEASSAGVFAPVPTAHATVGEGEDDRRQLAIVLPTQIGEGAKAESTISPNQEVPINEDGKRRVSERGDVTIPDCFTGTQEKEETARKGSEPKNVGLDERHEIKHVKANGNKEVESHEGPISNTGAEPTIEGEAQADEEDYDNLPPKSVSDKTDGPPSTSRPLPASELRQSKNECENPKSVMTVSCAHARNHANRILRNPRAMYRSSPMKTHSVSVPLPSSNIKEVEEEDEDEKRRIYNNWLKEYQEKAMWGYNEKMEMDQMKIAECLNQVKALEKAKNRSAEPALGGGQYTWSNKRSSPILAKLDRFLVTKGWLDLHKNVSGRVLPRLTSDHNPIMLETEPDSWGALPFRFEDGWLLEDSFKEKLKTWWEDCVAHGSACLRFSKKLKSLKYKIRAWAKERNIDFDKEKAELLDKIQVFDRIEELNGSLSIPKGIERDLLTKAYEDKVTQERIYWKQRARFKWVKEGDGNTKFFHAIASAHKRRNRISSLTIDGVEISSKQQIIKEFTDFYSDLYDDRNIVRPFPSGLPLKSLPPTARELLEKPFTMEEIEEGIRSLPSDKAPGPDGFTAEFYKQGWNFLKEDIINMFTEFYEEGLTANSMGASLIALVPKKEGACCPKEFRPISLLCSHYKLITRVLASRLRTVLHEVISDNQSAFLRGRQILDSPLMLHELLHHYKKRGKQGTILKLDFEKAFDIVHWPFLEYLMTQMNFPPRWRKWILSCVSLARYSILINGTMQGYFKGTRGLRQGDPISPLLFNIVGEALCALFKKAQEEGWTSGMEVGSIKIPILQFADDTLILCDGMNENLLHSKALLSLYEIMSGQNINWAKYGIMGINCEEA